MDLKAEHLKRKEVCFFCKHFRPYTEWGEEGPDEGWCAEFGGEDLKREFYCGSFDRSAWSIQALHMEADYKAA